MAEVDLFGWMNAQNFAATGDVVTTIFLYLFIMLGGTALVFGGIYLLSFKHEVNIKQNSGSGSYIIRSKARQFKTKEGITYWRILKYIKEKHPAPPDEAVLLTKKGNFWAICDRSIDGSINWRSRNIDANKPDVLTAEERSMTVNEMRRANDYLRKDNWAKVKELVLPIAFIMILALIFAFWGEITTSTTATADANRASNAELAKACGDISNVCLPLLEKAGLTALSVVQNDTSGGLRPGDVIPPN